MTRIEEDPINQETGQEPEAFKAIRTEVKAMATGFANTVVDFLVEGARTNRSQIQKPSPWSTIAQPHPQTIRPARGHDSTIVRQSQIRSTRRRG